MRNRQQILLWMEDLIEHMTRCHAQLQWAADGPGEAFLTEALLSDLNECRRLCEQLRAQLRKEALVSSQ
jgi:hypothetical protein